MKKCSLYLVRHGQRLDAVDKNWYEKDDNQYDPPLSDAGFEQAECLAERLLQEPIDYIFVSPYLRALQTAHPIAEALDLPLYVENGIGEWLGKTIDYIGNNVILTEGALKNSLHHLFHHREIKA
jgi:broad specificity phosphatase PhoE